MRKLSLTMIILLAFVFMSAKLLTPLSSPAPPTPSPHGDDFKISCDVCHSSAKGWKLDKEIYSFDHNTTLLPLEGQHQLLDCKLCHPTLKFKEAKTGCIDCHTDMHAQTVGPDCGRCHTPKSWIVNNITEIHQQSRFPLVGPHYTSDCSGCHKSASLLRFDPLGTECYDCHQANYAATTNPNHIQAGYSTNCTDCHSMNSFTWGPNVDHSFFPLTAGHAIDCKKCHTSGTFTKLPSECFSCHQNDYNTTNNPNHTSLQFSTNCSQCHTTNPGWKPATVDHGTFPLTLGHSNVDCNSCHNGNYTNTSKECVSCHQSNYNATTNPNHVSAQFPTTCDQCHTTNPGWKPATFDHTSFPLTLGHSNVECIKCHLNGNYTNTSKECYSCHQANYNATTNPNHVSLNLSTNCSDCHTTNPGWKPAQFTIHDTYFPIYSGKHNRPVWNNCTDCHTNTANYTQFTCITCHPHNNKTETDSKHDGVNGYTYENSACYACHPTGSAEGGFNHNTIFPLTGAHTTTPCNDCHTNGFPGTPTACSACHISAFNQTGNPNHVSINIPNTCADCHTTNPGWKPAAFPIHSNYYALTGAHNAIANNCSACHQGNYNTTPNTCVGCHLTNYNQTTNPNHVAINIPNTCTDCHTTNPAWKPATFSIHNNYYVLAGAHLSQSCAACHNGNYNNLLPTECVGCHLNNYNQTTNPNHASAQFPTTCEQCHNQNAWTPSTWDHDGQYFPIYSGKHQGKWNLCSDCHTNPSNYAVFTCTTSCHPQGSTNQDHSGVPGYSYNSDACYSCHPTGSSGGKILQINNSNFKKD